MRIVGTLKGEGYLVIDGGEPTGPVGYHLEVQESRAGTRGGFGRLEATQSETFDAFSSSDVKLRLANGEDVEIIIPDWSPSGSVKFKTSGPIPGF